MQSSDIIKQPHVGIVALTERDDAGVSDAGDARLHEAVEARDPSRLRRLLDAGADPDQPDDAGDTALMVACRGDLTLEAKVLLDHGADPNHSNRGWTALRYCAKDRNARIIHILLDAGALIPSPQVAREQAQRRHQKRGCRSARAPRRYPTPGRSLGDAVDAWAAELDAFAREVAAVNEDRDSGSRSPSV